MRILIDLTALADNFTGIERYAACISHEMIMQSDKENYILLFKEQIHPLFEKVCQKDNVETIILRHCHKLIFNQICLPWAIHRCKADWYLFLAFPVPVLTFKKNMMSTIHDICCWDCPETMNGLSKWYFRLSHRVAMKKCRYIITISEFSKKRIVDRLGYPEDRILLIYCGIGNEFYKGQWELQEIKGIIKKYHLPDRYILSLSTLEPRKNLSLLIAAYSNLVLETEMRMPLVLAGRKGWKTDALLEDVPSAVREQIIFTGFIEDEDLPYVYHNAEFFVFPSKYEGFGIPPLEAMACGIPVLSSDAASMPEVLGGAAVYFKSGDVIDLQRQLYAMHHMSGKERERLRKWGYEQTEMFSWKEQAVTLLGRVMGIQR